MGAVVYTMLPVSVEPRAKINATGLQSPFFRSSEVVICRRSRAMSASGLALGTGFAMARVARAATRSARRLTAMMEWMIAKTD